MNKRINQQHKNIRQVRKRKRKWPTILTLIFSIIIIAIAVFLGLLPKSSEESIMLKPTDTQPGLTTDDADWNLTLVNKWNPIPENYQINLVEIPGGETVDERIYEPLMEMLEAAEEKGLEPVVVSGYRTHKKQKELFDDKVKEYKRQGYSDDEAFKQANMWVSVPGYSEHQLGFAVDINGAFYDVYLWLQENSYKYGFIFRYPGDKTDITGAAQEVWHYRYVGVEAATKMYEQGLCLEEYLGHTKK